MSLIWKFNIGDIISDNVVNLKIMGRDSGHKPPSYKVTEISGLYSSWCLDKDYAEAGFVLLPPAPRLTGVNPCTHSTETFDKAFEKLSASMGLSDGDHVHDLRIYDSGWTKEEYCTGCDHKRKL